MVKIVVLYPQPEDPAAFDSHYFGRHVSLVRQLPGLEKVEVSRLRTGPDTLNPHTMIAEMYFRSRDEMKAALKSPEMTECVKDAEQNLKVPTSVYLSEDIQG